MSNFNKFESCLYRISDTNIHLYIPFPSLDELKYIGITKFDNTYSSFLTELLTTENDKYITDARLKTLKNYFKKEFLGGPKREIGNYISYVPYLSFSQRENMTSIFDLHYQGDLKEFKYYDFIEGHIRRTYPTTYQEIQDGLFNISDIHFLDDSIWTIKTKYIDEFEYFHVDFELGYAAKLLAPKSTLQFYNNGNFWYENFFSQYFDLDEYLENEINFFSLRDESI